MDIHFENLIRLTYRKIPDEQKRYFEIWDDVEEVIDFFQRFTTYYEYYLGAPHPHITFNSLCRVICKLRYAEGEHCVLRFKESADYEDALFDKFLNTDYGEGCDYSVSLFMSDMIRVNLMFAVHRGDFEVFCDYEKEVGIR